MSFEFNTAFPWGYCNEISYIIMAQLKYKPWNQYYYSHMNNEQLTQMIDWAYKEYRKEFWKNQLHRISSKINCSNTN